MPVDAVTGQPLKNLPAGHDRDEQEKINTDLLAEAAETKAEEEDTVAIDPKALTKDREILAHFNHANQLAISNPDPAHIYYWCGTAGGGVMVTWMLGVRIRSVATGQIEPIWEVVKDNPGNESWENRDVTGVRRIGDTILLRARKDRFALYEQWKAARNRKQQNPEAAAGILLNAGEQAQRAGLGIRVSVNSPLADPHYRALARRAANMGIARQQFDNMLKEGKVPGLVVPGAA